MAASDVAAASPAAVAVAVAVAEAAVGSDSDRGPAVQARELQRPLDRGELGQLTEFLAAAPGAMSYPEACGFVTAIASAPTTLMPSVWQPEMLGERGFSSREHATHVIGLVMRLYNQIVTGLSEGTPIARMGAEDDTIGNWCAGYLRGAYLDGLWSQDERGAVFLFPMAILSGEADLVGHEDSDGKVIEDPSPPLQRCREILNATVHEANQYWTAWRRKSLVAPVVSRSPKVGRNEPCSCGSGLKFKKCCALKGN